MSRQHSRPHSHPDSRRVGTVNRSNLPGQAPLPPSWLRTLSARPNLVMAVVTAAMLLPFVAKPFHIDDPMYIWAGEHILKQPLDFYNFIVAWAGGMAPMYQAMQNPPLASYLIAATAKIAGLNEIPIHLSFFIPALLLIIGTYMLARSFCTTPILAALLTAVSPVFVLSGTTVMCDILMVCFWVWSTYFWDRGLRRGQWGSLIIAGVLAGAAGLSKYPGINLLPLLGACTILRRAPWRYLLALLIPVIMLAAYDQYTRALYGKGLLVMAMLFTSHSRQGRTSGPIAKQVVTICFTGACLLPAFLLAPALWRKSGLILGVIALVMTIVVLMSLDSSGLAQLNLRSMSWWMMPQIALWAVAGGGVLTLTVLDLWKRRDAEAALLAMWIFGTFAFAGIVNWSVNGRSILPMAPAVAIVLVRRLEDRDSRTVGISSRWVPAAIGFSAIVCLAVAWADYAMARSARLAADHLKEKYGQGAASLIFQGHWGFQYYMQQDGARPFVPGRTLLNVGDYMVIPTYNVNTQPIGEPLVSPVEMLTERACSWFSTMNITIGAGFYSDVTGPLPFVFGPAPDETYQVNRINVGFDPDKAPATRPGGS